MCVHACVYVDEMSVPAKQERTVCVLLPTKETLDITVGVNKLL